MLSASSEAEVDEWVEAVVRAGGKRSTRWSEPTAYQALEPEHAPPRSGASTPTQQTPPASPSRPLTPTRTSTLSCRRAESPNNCVPPEHTSQTARQLGLIPLL